MQEKWYKKYVYSGVTAALVLIVVILFYQMCIHFDKVKDFMDAVGTGLGSVLTGIVLAYLLNPILNFFEHRLFQPMATFLINKTGWIKNKTSVIFKLARTCSIIATLLFFFGVAWGFLWMVTPQIYNSIISISENIPTYLKSIQAWVEEIWVSNAPQQEWLNNMIEQGTGMLSSFLNNDLIPKLGDMILDISNGVIGGVTFVFNFVVGIIVSVYIMASKERFGAQFTKLLYAISPAPVANKTLTAIRKMDSIFGGFINGKIVDSLIIGVLCYFAMLILKLPYPVLISVIVGVTNVIPFFGPFIGAIPSAIIVLLVSPMQCVVFVIWIFVLQQLDGNVIGPLILGDSTGVSGFWIIVSISLAGKLFGVTGMILGVPVFACLYNLIRYSCEYFLEKKNMPTASDDFMRFDSVDEATGTIIRKQNKVLVPVEPSDMVVTETAEVEADKVSEESAEDEKKS